MTKRKLLMVANVDWFFISHRLCIAEKAVKESWDVYVACQDTGRSNEIKDQNINFINLSFSRSGTNLKNEIKTIREFYKLYKELNPDIVHHITLKPVIYGSFISRLVKIKGTLNAISGLGYNFTGNRKSITQKIMIFFMKYGFNQPNLAIIFQNKDDHNEIKGLNVLGKNNKVNFIKGSGVDLDKFAYTKPTPSEKVRILLPIRMLWDKGVAELRKASKILKKEYKGKIVFILSGLADTENRAGVTEDYLRDWEEEGYVNWIGYQKDMVRVYQDSDIVVLPSYREGMPKSLIEACSIGRPIVTTDAIGCRECVEEGKNGFKVPVKSTVELAKALEKLINSESDRITMGAYSRKKAELEFSQKMVVLRHIDIYNGLYD